MARADKSGIFLTSADAGIVKGMLERGDRQHDIASWFGVNGGRIAEISTGERFASAPVITRNLPPSGPYITGRTAIEAKKNLMEVRKQTKSLLSKIDDILDEI